jgi:hypothetical protein
VSSPEASAANAANANADANGHAAASSTYAIGAIYPTLPAGCVTPTVGGVTCKAAYGANGVYYRAVPP